MPIYIDFPFILTMAVIVVGVIALADVLVFANRRVAINETKVPYIIEFSRSFFIPLLLVWIIRSFIVQPYRVPTGSLEPTVLPGDFIVVKQFSYGLRLPIFNTKIVKVGEPKRGDIALFHYPVDPKVTFVKRVIGLPGDHIVYKNNILYVNGKEMKQKYIGKGVDIEQGGITSEVDQYIEDLDGVKHSIFLKPSASSIETDVKVPEGHYFMIGDNRNESLDSRYWGFVPDIMLVGKAFGIWMSWDSINNSIRWNRLGRPLN